MKKIYQAAVDIDAESYGKLVISLRQLACYFSLIVRDSLKLNSAGREVLTSLQTFLISNKTVSEWPGTKLLHGQASRYTYALNEKSISTLLSTGGRLYAWQQPNLPEDLCFLRKDMTPIFVSVSHEHENYFELTEEEAKQLKILIPNITLEEQC
jgi:hypothetical protein